MSVTTKDKQLGRARRHHRLRKKVSGSSARPRLAVFRSNKHIVAQVIDDVTGRTLASASSLEAALREDGGGNITAAGKVGELLASRATEAGITRVVFDRGGFRYHGRVASLAEAARSSGLEF